MTEEMADRWQHFNLTCSCCPSFSSLNFQLHMLMSRRNAIKWRLGEMWRCRWMWNRCSMFTWVRERRKRVSTVWLCVFEWKECWASSEQLRVLISHSENTFYCWRPQVRLQMSTWLQSCRWSQNVRWYRRMWQWASQLQRGLYKHWGQFQMWLFGWKKFEKRRFQLWRDESMLDW